MKGIIDAFNVLVRSGLLKHEVIHFFVAIPFLILIWKKTREIKLVFLALACTYLIDADHLFDYWRYYGFTFNLSDFFKMEYFNGQSLAIIPFHAWEWLLLLMYVSYKKGWKSNSTAIALGIFPHLIWDAISVGSIVFYFISYRALMGFRIFI